MESPAMTLGRWVRRSLWHNRRAHAGVVAGVAVAGAILIGALAVGASVRHSLAKLTEARLEGTHLVLAPAGRFFREDLAAELGAKARAAADSWLALPGPPAVALDLFAGTGPIALHLAAVADRVIGVESYAPAVLAARENLALNDIQNVDMIAADVNDALPAGIPERVDLVVVDPPRPGLSPAAIAWITRLTPDAILYVSCNPATLARDLQLLLQAPYRLEAVEPFDFFPHTFHLETLVLLRRQA